MQRKRRIRIKWRPHQGERRGRTIHRQPEGTTTGSVQKKKKKKKNFQPEKPDDRERRGSMTSQRCRTNQRTTPGQEAAMKAFVMRLDTAQSIAQWCWRPPVQRGSRRVSQTRKEAEHVVVNYSAEVPEHLPRINDHEVAQAEQWRWRCTRRTAKP